MNRSIFFLICICAALADSYPTLCSIDLKFVAHLERFSYEIMENIDQSDIDPIIAQEISSQLSILYEKAVNNINEDRKDVLVASLLNTFLEVVNEILKDFKKTIIHTLLSDFKHCARINSTHKLLITLYPGTFTNQARYTDSYTETIGFILNTFIFSKALEFIIQIPSIQSIVAPDKYSTTKMWIMYALAGIAANFTWGLQKKAIYAKNNAPAPD